MGINAYDVSDVRLNGTWNQYVGYGMVDAYKAVKAVTEGPPINPILSTTQEIVSDYDLGVMGLGYDVWDIVYLARGRGQATCYVDNYDASATYIWSSTLPPYSGQGASFTVDFEAESEDPELHIVECQVLKSGLNSISGVHVALIPRNYPYLTNNN